MEFKDLMVTIPLSVYTQMVEKLAVQEVTEKKDGEITDLTEKMQKEIDDLNGEVNTYRSMWYEEHQKLKAIEERNEEDA